MTVGQKMHQTLAGLESAAASLKTFALDTQDQNAKTTFNDLSRQVDSISQQLQGRVNYIEQQEPKYKMDFEQQKNK